MSDKRAGLFEEEPDISDFKPKPPARPEQVKAVAEEAGFRSREPSMPAATDRATPSRPLPEDAAKPPPPRPEQRRYRTGRNQQLNLKVRAQDAEAFYALADAQGWVLGEAFARAISALSRELQAEKP